MLIYLDTAPVIYLVEESAPFNLRVAARLNQSPDDRFIASDLTRLECRVKPLRQNDAPVLNLFDKFFASLSQIIELPTPVFDLATRIRADYGFKTPDSLHLAAAMHANCEIFYTNDHRLDRFSGLSIEVV